MTPSSGATVTSGGMQFWIMTSTKVTHGGTSQVSFHSRTAANATAPSYISVSTGPVAVLYEGKQSGQLPVSTILVNLDESAVFNPAPSSGEFVPTERPDMAATQRLRLPKGANRAIVLEQRQLGATDWTAGVAFLRVVVTVK